MTNATGTVVEESDFQPFGVERVITDNLDNNYKFAGMERDTESALDHTLYRQYSSLLGRWESPDRVPGRADNPQSWNRYSYTGGDPLNYVDPNGQLRIFLSEGCGYSSRFGMVNEYGEDGCEDELYYTLLVIEITRPYQPPKCGNVLRQKGLLPSDEEGIALVSVLLGENSWGQIGKRQYRNGNKLGHATGPRITWQDVQEENDLMLDTITNMANESGRSVLDEIRTPRQFKGYATGQKHFWDYQKTDYGSNECNDLMRYTHSLYKHSEMEGQSLEPITINGEASCRRTNTPVILTCASMVANFLVTCAWHKQISSGNSHFMDVRSKTGMTRAREGGFAMYRAWGIIVCQVVFVCMALAQVGSERNGGAAPQSKPLLLQGGPGWEGPEEPMAKIPPLALPDGRVVVTAQDTIYMILPGGKVAWRYSPEVPLTAQPAFRPDGNEIGIVGLDLTFQRVNAETGQVVWKALVGGGRFVSTDIKPFRIGYLVLDDMAGYRDRESPDLPNSLAYYDRSSRDAQWETDFPIGAQLVVAGDHVYAMRYQKNSVTLEEISVPPQK